MLALVSIRLKLNWKGYNNIKPVYELSFDSTIVKFFLKSSGESSEKGLDNILDLIRNNGEITISETAKHLGISTRAIEKAIAKLKERGQLQRAGPDKGGYWKVLDKTF